MVKVGVFVAPDIVGMEDVGEAVHVAEGEGVVATSVDDLGATVAVANGESWSSAPA